MDKAFEIGRAAPRVDRLAREVEFHQIGRRDKPGRHAARQQKALGVLVVTPADMTKAVNDTLVVEDAVGGDEIVDQRRVCICHVILPTDVFRDPSGKQVAIPG
jgi:hypothetical protein